MLKVGAKKPDISLEKIGRRRAAVAVDEDLEREDTLEIQAFRKILFKGGEFSGPRGLKGEVGEVGRRGRRGLRGDTGDTGERGEVGLTGESIKGSDGLPGRDGIEGRQGATGQPGPKGDTGDVGPVPRHKWNGTRLAFELPGGEFGRSVNLQGPGGGRGASGNSGGGSMANVQDLFNRARTLRYFLGE